MSVTDRRNSSRRALAKDKGSRLGLGATALELKKAEKQHRIKMAARSLFSEFGFEGATVRQVAERAGVAIGTISLYANDKRDLVYLMYNEDIERMKQDAARIIDKQHPFEDILLRFFAVFYQGFMQNISLARIFLQMDFYLEGKNAAKFLKTRDSLLEELHRIVCIGQDNGQIRIDVKAEIIASHVFFIYASSVRWWIRAGNPDVFQGVENLRSLLRLAIQGISSRSGVKSAKTKLKAPPPV